MKKSSTGPKSRGQLRLDLKKALSAARPSDLDDTLSNPGDAPSDQEPLHLEDGPDSTVL